MNGIICINKDRDFTSFDVVAKMRGISGIRKVGHGGTLDPMATGVLPLFFGTATGAVDRLEQADKEYVATFTLGFTTDTLDITGQVQNRYEVNADFEQVKAAAMSFLGKSLQVPPMYSAIRVGGQRLYDLAREGIEVKREPRPIEIFDMDIAPAGEEHTYRLRVHCGKGTYIRSLIDDIGQKLGCGATMTTLVRTKSGPFTLDDCLTLQQAQENREHLQDYCLPVERLFETLPRIDLNSKKTRLFSNGVRLRADQVPEAKLDELCAVFGNHGEFLGLAKLTENEFVVEKMFFRR